MANKFIDEPSLLLAAFLGPSAKIGGALGLLYALYSIVTDQPNSDIWDLAIWPLGGAFAGVIIGILLAVVLIVLLATFEAVRHTKNPFLAILKLIIYPVGSFAFLDQILLGGNYIVKPLITFLIMGTIEGTIYSCQDWIIHEEGSYCNDW